MEIVGLGEIQSDPESVNYTVMISLYCMNHSLCVINLTRSFSPITYGPYGLVDSILEHDLFEFSNNSRSRIADFGDVIDKCLRLKCGDSDVGHNDVDDSMMVTDLRYCWLNHSVGDFFRYVGDFLNVSNRSPTSWIGHQHPGSVINIFNFSSTNLVSNICHQQPFKNIVDTLKMSVIVVLMF